MIFYIEGQRVQIKTNLPVEARWNEKENYLEILYTKENGEKKKYILRKSFKDGLVLN